MHIYDLICEKGHFPQNNFDQIITFNRLTFGHFAHEFNKIWYLRRTIITLFRFTKNGSELIIQSTQCASFSSYQCSLPTYHCAHYIFPLLNVPSPPTIVLILFLLFSMFPPHLPTIVLILFLLFSMFSPHPPLSSSYFSSSQCSHLTHPSTIVFILFHLLSLLSLFTHLLFLLFSSSKHCKSRWLHT